MRIVIPGGSGQVGQILARHFHAKGHAVTVIARRPAPQAWQTLTWDGITLGVWARALEGADVIINLAGRSVNCRYNKANRYAIKESRIATTKLVGEAIAQATNAPTLWMNASTATIYRHALDRDMDERTGELGGHEPDVPETWQFSIDVATSWERAFFGSLTPRTRKIALRSAMIMSPDSGGVLDVLIGLTRRGLGGRTGSGKQFVSWIHDHDFVSAIEFLIAREEFQGPINVSSPHPLPNREFMRALRQAWGTRIGLPAAAWMIEIGALFLRTESELILKSHRVVPGRLLEGGFGFKFPEWPTAAGNLVRRWKERRAAA